jgi:GNAT superfamily N-acetyltransferase
LGNFKGGHICHPRYGVLIESNPGDLFLAAIRDEPHGNLGPIEGERIACVFYLRGGCSLPRRRWFPMSDAVDRSDGAERSGEGMNTMTIQAECGDDLYPDELVCEILASTRPGRRGVSEYADGSLWYVFVWCDKTCAARGVLFIMPEADASGWVTGSDFTIFVHPNWRRKGIATKLYRTACSYYEFELAVDPLYTPACAAWALSVLESEAGSKPDEGQ